MSYFYETEFEIRAGFGPTKGYKKLKRFFQADVSSKKWKNEFYFTTETSGRLVFVRFLEEIEDTKNTFRN